MSNSRTQFVVLSLSLTFVVFALTCALILMKAKETVYEYCVLGLLSITQCYSFF